MRTTLPRPPGAGAGTVTRGLVAAALCVGASACGATRILRNGQTLAVSVTEDRVVPQSVDAPMGLLTVVVHNNGRLTHDLVISHDGVIAAQTPPLAPGQGATLTTVLSPGTYVMASTLLSDQALGADGTLRVGR